MSFLHCHCFWYQPLNHGCVVSNSTVVRSTTQPLTFEKKIKTGNGWVYSQPLNHSEADSIKAHYLAMSLILPQNQTLLLGFSVVVWLTLYQTISYSKLPLKLFWLSGWSLSTDIREWSSLKGMARLLLNKLHCGWVSYQPKVFLIFFFKWLWLNGWSHNSHNRDITADTFKCCHVISEWRASIGLDMLFFNHLHCGWVADFPINQKHS